MSRCRAVDADKVPVESGWFDIKIQYLVIAIRTLITSVLATNPLKNVTWIAIHSYATDLARVSQGKVWKNRKTC